MADISEIKVEKRDGRIEGFDETKLSSSMVKAGATDDQAKGLTQKIIDWVLAEVTGGVIKTSLIRTKVLELLRSVNQEAANTFEAYKKPA